MKFTLTSSVIFLATAALASPGGQPITNAMKTGSAAAVSTITSKAFSASSKVTSKLSTGANGQVTLTGTIGRATAAQSTSLISTISTGNSASASTETAFNTSTSTTNGGFARPTIVGRAVAGIVGAFGVMIYTTYV
ncbi:unnamed protein product [Penicillium pancosmium]